MIQAEVPTYTATIFIAGDYPTAKSCCQRHVMHFPLCVTIEPVEYVYTGGCEAGVRVGLINYARFPAEPGAIFAAALTLARALRGELAQHSFSIVATDKTVFETIRPPAESGLGDGTGRDPSPRKAARDEPPLYISREEGNSSSTDHPK